MLPKMNNTKVAHAGGSQKLHLLQEVKAVRRNRLSNLLREYKLQCKVIVITSTLGGRQAAKQDDGFL